MKRCKSPPGRYSPHCSPHFLSSQSFCSRAFYRTQFLQDMQSPLHRWAHQDPQRVSDLCQVFSELVAALDLEPHLKIIILNLKKELSEIYAPMGKSLRNITQSGRDQTQMVTNYRIPFIGRHGEYVSIETRECCLPGADGVWRGEWVLKAYGVSLWGD